MRQLVVLALLLSACGAKKSPVVQDVQQDSLIRLIGGVREESGSKYGNGAYLDFLFAHKSDVCVPSEHKE